MVRRHIVQFELWLVLCLVAASACGATNRTPSGASAVGASGLAVARIDTRDGEVRAALRDRALSAISACEAETIDRPAGHLELSVEVDAGGETVAGILHTTLGDEGLVECLARALTGVKMPTPGSPYRVRLRLEGH